MRTLAQSRATFSTRRRIGGRAKNRGTRTAVVSHMRTHRISLLGAVVVVVAAVSGGCGGYGRSKAKTASTATASSGGTVIKTVTVHRTEVKLTANTISLAKPGTYVFKGVNDGKVTHALGVEGNGVDQDSAHISVGSSGTLKVTLPKA